MRAGDTERVIAAGQSDPAFMRAMVTLTALGLWDRTKPAKVLRGFAKQAAEKRKGSPMVRT